MSEDANKANGGASSGFATTQWSLVRAANDDSAGTARGALEALCRRYWYPLYAYARRRGFQPSHAEDLTQGFFAQLLERRDLAKVDPARGRFRSFLLTAFQHFLLNQQEHGRALKRGGDRLALSLEMGDAEQRYRFEPADRDTPETLFARRWALDLLDRVRRQLRAEYVAAGKEPLYQRLQSTLAGEPTASTLAEIAAELQMSAGAVKVASHRLRQRFGLRLREEIAQTVDRPEEVDGEIRDLFEALRR